MIAQPDYRFKIIVCLWLLFSHVGVATYAWINGRDTGVNVSAQWVNIWIEMQEQYFCGENNEIAAKYMYQIVEGMPVWQALDENTKFLAWDLSRYAQKQRCKEFLQYVEDKPE